MNRSIENAELPKRYGGAWSHKDIEATGGIPFDDPAEFTSFMRRQPFIAITGLTEIDRENLAAAILKRTFSFGFTRYGAYRARFADAETDMSNTKGFDGEEFVRELSKEYRTYIMLSLDRVPKLLAQPLRRIFHARRDIGRYTVVTMPSFTSLANIDESVIDSFIKTCTVVTL